MLVTACVMAALVGNAQTTEARGMLNRQMMSQTRHKDSCCHTHMTEYCVYLLNINETYIRSTICLHNTVLLRIMSVFENPNS